MSGGMLRGGGVRRTYDLLCANARPHVAGRTTQMRNDRHILTKSKAEAAAPSPASSPAFYTTRPLSYVATASAATKSGFVAWYLRKIESRPVLTKSVTSGSIFAVADITSQMITSSDALDLIRTLRMAGYGTLISGPTLHMWYNFMSRVFPKQDFVNALKKMFFGQAVFGPTMTVVFLSVNAGLQGESSNEIVARLKRDLIPTIKNALIYWPICDFITNRFAPVHLQPLVNNSFSLLWTIYMTHMASLTKAS